MELGEENGTNKEKDYLVTETNCETDGIVGAANLIMNTQENLIVDEALLDTTNDLLNLSLFMNPAPETEIGPAEVAEVDITNQNADFVQATEPAKRRRKRKRLGRGIAQPKTKACILGNRPLTNMRQHLEKYHSISHRVELSFCIRFKSSRNFFSGSKRSNWRWLLVKIQLVLGLHLLTDFAFFNEWQPN